MKVIKRIVLNLLILTTIGILFCGWLYRQAVSYKSAGIRASYVAKNHNLIDHLSLASENNAKPEIEQIILLGLSITSEKLNFTTDKNEVDPNKLINTETAHCIGYAMFFSTTCNFLLKKHKLSNTWVVKAHVGEVFLFGYNIHSLFYSPFFKDHDFVTIENKFTGEIYSVDPTVHDYLSIDFITYEQ